jgi:hypothetical protein
MLGGSAAFMTGQEESKATQDRFSLAKEAAYAAWREKKLAAYPVSAADFLVVVENLAAPTKAEREAILRRVRRANFALYETPTNLADERRTRRNLIAFGHAFGLTAVEDHRSAEADGIVRIEIVDQGGRLGYIPYTDKPINWHTDGYYNFHGPDRAVQAMLLHCVRPASEGGVNRLLDPEIAYIRLRDLDPGHIEALAHPQAMTIPKSVEACGRVRRENVGPVFFRDPRSGALAMRYTARKRNVVWRDDPATRRAVAALERILDSDPLTVEVRLGAGQGLVCNNVLHDRTAFAPVERPGRGRLIYRVRYAGRIEAGDDSLLDE